MSALALLAQSFTAGLAFAIGLRPAAGGAAQARTLAVSNATIAPHFFQDVKAPSEFKADGFVVTSVCPLESERVK